MRIADVLRGKGGAVVTIKPDATVSELLSGLAEHNIGAMVVVGPDGVKGIVSERDVVRQLHAHGAAVLSLPVEKIMTAVVSTCTKSDTVDSLTLLMTEHRVRPHPTRPAVVIPAAATDFDPVPVGGVPFLTGQHQAEQCGVVAADHQHRAVLTAGRVFLVRHPGPHHLARVGATIQVGRIDQLAGPMRSGSAVAGHRPAGGDFGRRFGNGADDRVYSDLDAP